MRDQVVLITGGSDGIGLSLARRFVHGGATVLVTGRSESKLEAAARSTPGLLTLANDLGKPEQREALAEHVRRHLPGLTWLINNAGIQRRVALAVDRASWQERQQEIDVLFAAPIHLNHLLLPLLLSQRQPTTIVNVTSGGAYVPQVFAPVYSASKAALRSYTQTLRHALAQTSCRVVEVAPPAVQTSLAVPAHGEPLESFTAAMFQALLDPAVSTFGYGPTAGIEGLTRVELDRLFVASAERAAVSRYPGPRTP